MTDNVVYDFVNRRRIEDAIKSRDDDQALLIGDMLCINPKCGHKQTMIAPVEDWMLSPPPGECEECGRMSSMFILDDRLIRIASRQQEAGK